MVLKEVSSRGLLRYSKTPQTRTYFSKKQTVQSLINQVFMAFSRCGSYRKDNGYYDEFIGIRYVLKKPEGRMTAFEYHKVWYFVVDKATYQTA